MNFLEGANLVQMSEELGASYLFYHYFLGLMQTDNYP